MVPRRRPTALKRMAAALACSAFVGACATARKTPTPAPTPPAALCADASLEVDDFCMPAEWLDDLLRAEQFEVVAVEVAPSGFSRPKKLHLRIPGDRGGESVVIAIKWKPAPRGGEGFNNHPRKELAAYEFQQLFLDPDEYVIPPTTVFCIPVTRHRAEISDEPPTFPGTRCVLGLAAYWLQNVTSEGARDLERFERDPAFRASLAKLNLLTHLIDQRDSRTANFLRSTDPDRPRLFSIDNGLAFGGFKNPFTLMGFIADWAEIHVPALPRRSVERLRALTRSDLDRLAVVAQFERRDGMLVRVAAGAPRFRDRGVRVEGSTIQLGLTRREIDRIHERLRLLLERVDRGGIELF
ncbi:MAG: hypothetical protein ACE5FL_03700 [Myxococcota bacterium]